MRFSFKVGSMRLRHEWLWRARRYKIAPGESVQYWCLFLFLLFLPCFSSTSRQTNDDNIRNVFEYCPWFSRVQSLHLRLEVLVMTKKMNQFLRHFIIGGLIFSWFNISPSSFSNRYSSCGWAGRISSLYRLAKSPAFNLNAYSSSCTSELPGRCCSNSWPTCWGHEKRNFQYRPNLGVPCDPTFRFKCFFVSWQSVLTAGHCICELWEFCSVACHENIVRFQQHSGILHPYKICSICLVVTIQFVLHIFAIEDLCEHDHHYPTARLSWSRLAQMKNSIVPSQQVSPIYHEELRFFTHFCDYSVETEQL